MSASIFSFARARQQADGHLPRFNDRLDWTTQELAELYRVCDRLVEAGLRVSLQRGLSDEGEPWAVFERDESSDVIVHIARIDGCLIVVNNSTEQVYRGVDFRAVTEQMLHDAPLALPRRHHDPKVVYHPRAVFTAFVAAAVVVMEFARNVESAHAADAAKGAEAASQGGVFAHLVARFLSRDNAPLQGIAAGTTAFGVLSAAAIAVDLMANDFEGSDAMAAGGSIDASSVASAKESIESQARGSDIAVPAASGSSDSAIDAQQDFLANFTAFNSMLALDDLRNPKSGQIGEDAPAPVKGGDDIRPMLTVERDISPVVMELALVEEIELAAQATGHGGSASGRPVTAAASSEARPVENSTAASASDRQKILENFVFDSSASTKKADDGSVLFVTSLGKIKLEGQKSGGDGAILVSQTGEIGDLLDAATNGVWHDLKVITGEAKLKDGQTDVVFYQGGDVVLNNFRFGEDQIWVGNGDATEWIKELNIDGNDVHIVGIDGGRISLIDSFHTLA
jgi:hypothetical protein